MANNVTSNVPVCPYRQVSKLTPVTFDTIVERFDFQISEGGLPEIISLGKFDVIKEIASHEGEVGLINVLKLAEGRLIDPSNFAKKEPGLMLDVDEIATLDDLIKAQNKTDAFLKQYADKLGISVDELTARVTKGTLSDLINSEEASSDGGNDNG